MKWLIKILVHSQLLVKDCASMFLSAVPVSLFLKCPQKMIVMYIFQYQLQLSPSVQTENNVVCCPAHLLIIKFMSSEVYYSNSLH